MIFRDRKQAALTLLKKLEGYKNHQVLVLAIPNGAVEIGRIIAHGLQGDLDVVLVHKLGHPANEEYGVGAIDETGHVYQDAKQKRGDVTDAYLKLEAGIQLSRLKRRRKAYTPSRGHIDPKNRTVILVDDGIATGWTMKAAIDFIKRIGPKKIVVAVGVASPQSAHEIEKQVDHFVCIQTPEHFHSVGQYYEDFNQVKDEDVMEILATI